MIEQVRKILAEGENQYNEFKRSRTELNKNTFDSICAFLNRKGGNLLLGVNDNGEIEGIEESKIQEIVDRLVSLLNNPQKLSPTIYLIPGVVEIEGKKIIYLQIPESSQVHSTNGKIFDRNSDGDFNIAGNHKQVEELYLRKSNSFSESGIYKYLSFKNFRVDLITRVRKLASIRTPGHPWEGMTDEELLRSAKLYRKDFKTAEEGYTLAAALLFGKDEVIQSILPAYKTDALVRIVNTDRYDDRLEVRTNLIESYDQLMDFVRKHLPDPFYLENDQHISLRDKIFREVIVNTLVHREYINSFPSRMVIENQKVNIENWNKPYMPGVINPDNFYTHPKNPNILEVFKQIGRADELGSGVRNVYKYGRLYGNSDPIFEEGDVFKVIISIPQIYSIKGKSKVADNFSYSDTENIQNDTEAEKNDTVDIKNDTESLSVRIYDAVNDAVNDTVIKKVKLRLVEIIKVLIDTPGLKPSSLSEKLNVSEVTIKRDIQKIKGLVVYKGGQSKGGYFLTSDAIEKIRL